MGLKYLNKTVSGVNTATALAATSTPCAAFTIQADKDNATTVYFGNSETSSTSDQGIILSVTDGDAFPAQMTISGDGSPNCIDLKDVYISSANASSRVNVIYIEQ